MSFRKLRSSPSREPALSPGELQALERIRSEWARQENGYAPRYEEIIEIALHRMRQDLDSDRCGEVMEDVQREIVYREWCARIEQGERAERLPAQPVPHSRRSL